MPSFRALKAIDRFKRLKVRVLGQAAESVETSVFREWLL